MLVASAIHAQCLFALGTAPVFSFAALLMRCEINHGLGVLSQQKMARTERSIAQKAVGRVSE